MTSLRLELSAVLFAWTAVACSSSPSTAPASPPNTEDTAPSDDADETTPPACQADLATDPKNCGACGRDCAAGACNDGRCAPAVFATNASQVTVMTVAGDTLVWSQEGQYVPGFGTGSIQRCALDSCDASEILVDKISKPWIAVAGSKLYGTNDIGFVFSCSLDKACKAPRALVDLRTKSGFLVGVAATASNVFFINRGTTDSTGNWPSEVTRCGLPGGCDPLEGTAAPFASVTSALSIVADDSRAYWLSIGKSEIESSDFAKRYGSPITIAGGILAPTSLALDATRLYFGTGLAGKFADKNLVGRVDKTGDGRVDLIKDLPVVGSVAVDDQFVYWTEPTAGNVRRIPKTGGDASVVASGEKEPRVLAVGPHAIYWSSQSGKIIRRLTK